MGIGSQTEDSKARGKGDRAHGARIGSLSLTLFLAAGLDLTKRGILFTPRAAPLMGVIIAVHGRAIVYIQLRVAGPPAVLTTLASFGILYGFKDMRTPF